MCEVHRWKAVKLLGFGGSTFEYVPHGPEVVLADDFDRVQAVNQALQARLTVQDQRVDELYSLARNLIIQGHARFGFTENHPDCIRDLAALNPTAETASYE